MRAVTLCADNHITLLHNGAAFFPALVAAIDAARAEIYLETYIFADDDTAQLVQQALIRAAQRGVAVRVIADWLGTGRQRSASLQQEFAASGVMYRTFNPWFRRGVARMHRKICVSTARSGLSAASTSSTTWCPMTTCACRCRRRAGILRLASAARW